METRVFLGKKPERIRRDAQGRLITELTPQLELSMPVLFSAMSYGSISFNAHESLARAAEALGICYNTGEGGLHEDLYRYGRNTITQVASGRFGVHENYLMAGAAIEIKMGRGQAGHRRTPAGGEDRRRCFPHPHDPGGIRRHFPGAPPRYLFHRGSPAADLLLKGSDAVPETGDRQGSRGPQHRGPSPAGIARGGTDIIAIDGFRGGTGAAPTRIRDNVGIPIELALAAVDQRLREEGIRQSGVPDRRRQHPFLCRRGQGRGSGSGRLLYRHGGADRHGCHLCRTCQSGRCAWGIATARPELVKRLDPDESTERLINLMTAWKHEIMEIMGGMGINSIEALRGNRLMLRAVGLTEKELSILGVAHAGE